MSKKKTAKKTDKQKTREQLADQLKKITHWHKRRQAFRFDKAEGLAKRKEPIAKARDILSGACMAGPSTEGTPGERATADSARLTAIEKAAIRLDKLETEKAKFVERSNGLIQDADERLTAAITSNQLVLPGVTGHRGPPPPDPKGGKKKPPRASEQKASGAKKAAKKTGKKTATKKK